MSVLATEPRQYMSRLTNGWRFTLPTPIRKSRGWDTGTRLIAKVRGASLVFTPEAGSMSVAARSGEAADTEESRELASAPMPDAAEPAATSVQGNLARDLDDDSIPPVECYLGSGGKIVLPATLRRHLGWVIGKQVVIVDEGDVVALTLCCDVKRCESCGGMSGVREIIPNVYLCSQCWQKYLHTMNSKLKWGRAKA